MPAVMSSPRVSCRCNAAAKASWIPLCSDCWERVPPNLRETVLWAHVEAPESEEEDAALSKCLIFLSKNDGRGDWITTISGGQYFITSPSPNDICLRDIEWGLSHNNRYSGQSRYPYNVAEHSVHESDELLRRYPGDHLLALHGLLHDAPEAFLGEMTKPLKQTLAYYSYLERLAEIAIYSHFGLPRVTPQQKAAIKLVDSSLLATERRDLITPRRDWERTEPPLTHLDLRIPMSPATARLGFHQRWESLTQLLNLTLVSEL